MGLTPLAVTSAVAAGIAVALWVPGSRARLQRLAEPAHGHRLWLRVRTLAGFDADRRSLRSRGVAAVAVLLLVLTLAQRSGGAVQIGAWPVGLVAVGLLMGLLGRLESREAHRRRGQLIRDLPQALDLLAGCLSAGLPLRSATAAVRDAFDGPLAEELGNVSALVELGTAEADAWNTLRGHPQLGAVAVDVSRSVDSGTMLVDTLNRHAGEARQRRHAAVEIAAKAVGVRSVLPMMLCFIPSFLLLGIVPTVVSALQSALPF